MNSDSPALRNLFQIPEGVPPQTISIRPASQQHGTVRLRCGVAGVALIPAGIAPHGHISNVEIITLSMRLSEAQGGDTGAMSRTSMVRRSLKRLLGVHAIRQGVQVCTKVDLQHRKLEISMLGSPTIFPLRFALRTRSNANTKADIDQAWNCFIGQPSTLQDFEVSNRRSDQHYRQF